jgi:holo-[acyl-carrier protein] synthase
MTSRLTSGVDLIEISRFAEIDPDIRERFIQRVFTAGEKEQCAGLDERLAGKFAAKEAVAKALGSGIGQVHWREIIILDDPSGQPVVELVGKAAQVAEALHLTDWSVSISHTREVAAAIAVGMRDQ